MISTVNSLKDLYVKLGGSLTDTYESIANGVPVADYNVIPDMIEAITQKAGSGGGGGGGSVLIVEGTWDNSILTLNKTWKEIHDAALAGSVVLYKEEPHEGYIITSGVFYCSQVYNEGSAYTVYCGNNGSFTTSSETGYPSYDYDS